MKGSFVGQLIVSVFKTMVQNFEWMYFNELAEMRESAPARIAGEKAHSILDKQTFIAPNTRYFSAASATANRSFDFTSAIAGWRYC